VLDGDTVYVGFDELRGELTFSTTGFPVPILR